MRPAAWYTPSLQVLDASMNGITVLPPELGAQVQLMYLNLSRNEISGDLQVRAHSLLL